MQLGTIPNFPQVTPVLASSAISQALSRQQAATNRAATAASPFTDAASSAAALMVEAAYINSVGGTKYDASVLQSDDEYVASVPNLPLATASGETLDAVESNLTARIDALV